MFYVSDDLMSPKYQYNDLVLVEALLDNSNIESGDYLVFLDKENKRLFMHIYDKGDYLIITPLNINNSKGIMPIKVNKNDVKGNYTLFKALREQHILVRHFNAPRIDQYLRISIGTDEQMDELLKAMGEDGSEEALLADLKKPVEEMSMGTMDQAMIDALLAGAAGETVLDNAVSDDMSAKEVSIEEAQLFDSPEEFEKALMAEMKSEGTVNTENMDDIVYSADTDASSMLAQLMEEMQEEDQRMEEQSFDDDFMTEESIEALLSAAKNSSADVSDEQTEDSDISNTEDMAEIEALLGMSESGEIFEENNELLRMLEEAGAEAPKQINGDEVLEVDEAELDAILSMGNAEGTFGNTAEEVSGSNKKKKVKKEKVKKEKKVKEKKEKKSFEMKGLLRKIFSALMEEIPEDGSETEEGLKLSEENQTILDELDQEGKKKAKFTGKKNKNEKNEASNKKKKPKKEKKPKKGKKPKKEKKPKLPKRKENAAPEKKIPKKKIIVTFIFAFSVLVLILLVEFLMVPMITQSRARSAYDKGDYYEAYKEYYGQKLSEEDEKRFQSAITILRMQSNLDGYNNYMRMNKEMNALHCLL